MIRWVIRCLIVVGWRLGPWVLIQPGVRTHCISQWDYIISIIRKNAFKMSWRQALQFQYTSTMFIFISIYKSKFYSWALIFMVITWQFLSSKISETNKENDFNLKLNFQISIFYPKTIASLHTQLLLSRWNTWKCEAVSLR